jgi:16S rRNA (uracil1498-N3)-methyltransferase
MSGPLFFVEHLDVGDLTLSTSDSRHALRSLRLRQGAEVSLADGKGRVAHRAVLRERDGLALVRVDEVSQVVRRGTVVSVAFAPPKGDRLSWAIQKLGELGVDEAVLFTTGRSVREVRADRSAQALSRLRTVAREAAMQSRQPFIMDVVAGASFEECLSTGGVPAALLAQSGTRGLRSLLPSEAGGVRLLVGPEGGWTDEEIEAAGRAGVAIWSLGPNVLRTETAAVVGAALVLAYYERLG